LPQRNGVIDRAEYRAEYRAEDEKLNRFADGRGDGGRINVGPGGWVVQPRVTAVSLKPLEVGK
jgi:hypothetical protein